MGKHEWVQGGHPITEYFCREAYRCAELFDRKHSDYGFGNHLKYGEKGILVRMADKLARLDNLVWKDGATPSNEAIEDTYRDLANYAIIALLIHNGTWAEYAKKEGVISTSS